MCYSSTHNSRFGFKNRVIHDPGNLTATPHEPRKITISDDPGNDDQARPMEEETGRGESN